MSTILLLVGIAALFCAPGIVIVALRSNSHGHKLAFHTIVVLLCICACGLAVGGYGFWLAYKAWPFWLGLPSLVILALSFCPFVIGYFAGAALLGRHLSPRIEKFLTDITESFGNFFS